MARILIPEDYGIMGMIAIIIALATALSQGGFADALIQRKEAKDIDFNTAFVFNILVAIILYLSIFLCSRHISNFYNEPRLIKVTKVVSINILFSAFTVVQRTRKQKMLDFKTISIINFLSFLVSGITGISFAIYGFGYWSLIFQALMENTMKLAGFWIFTSWYPKFRFNYSVFKNMFSFGSKLLMISVTNKIFNNIIHVLIGKYYTAKELGFFYNGKKFQEIPVSTITTIVQTVLFPALSSINDNKVKLKKGYRLSIQFYQ